ncbi:hypothetical protein [Phycicoccus sp. Soil748]|uniref:hypothetical protein n=1 Tax=Intrasporangiaceae TaxID=85021 RepID=UPI000702808C|nr:hypothetical protein [Phycicoccus sp. Soil748]KRE52781.1 hypothetical protein ASG70_15645 [Phycicoccus sp. Soil748]
MGTMRGTINRRVALRLVLALVAVWAFWQAAQPTAECSQWGQASPVETAMPATGIVQTPVGCQR